METTQGNATATATATAAPAAATVTTSSPASTGATSTPVETQTQPDGNQGSGALTHEQSVDAMMAAFEKKNPAEKTTTSDGKPAADTEAATTSNTSEGEQQTQEQQTTDSGEQQEEDSYSFDEDGFVGARDLAAKLDAIEALKGVLPDDLRNEILANARIAEQMSPYREIFGSPDEARVVAQAAQDYSSIQSTFQAITADNVAQGTSALLNTMLRLSAYKDENGQPRRRDDGTYITDGTTTRFLNELFDRKFNASIVKKIEASGDEAAKAALDLVMERAGLRPSTADNTNQDPTIAAERAKLAEERKQLSEQREADRQTAVKSYTDALNGDLNTLSQTAFDKLLSYSEKALDPVTKTVVLAKLSKAVKAAIKADSGYQIEKRALESQPMTAARRQKEVALAKRWMATKLTKVAKPILTEAGTTVTAKAAQKQEAQAARANAARGDVNGGAPGATRPTTAQTPQQQRTVVETALQQKLGRTPTDQEVNIEMMLNLPGIKNRAA